MPTVAFFEFSLFVIVCQCRAGWGISPGVLPSLGAAFYSGITPVAADLCVVSISSDAECSPSGVGDGGGYLAVFFGAAVPRIADGGFYDAEFLCG